MDNLPAHLVAEKERIAKEVREAFAGVTREGGVSWRESVVVDNNGSSQQCAEARSLDKDTDWEQLVDDKEWNACTGVGGWSFLDAIGFRYYLPVGMLRELAGDSVDGFPFQLSVGRWFGRDYTLEQLSMLNVRQRRCVRDFVRVMAEVHESENNEVSARGWRKAYDSYWIQIDS